MNTTLEQIFADAEGRYLQNAELEALSQYTQSIPKRMQAMKAIEKVEGPILQEVINEVWRKHPDFESRYGMSREKCTRDVGYVLRYCTLAMLRDDTTFLTEKLLYWMRTVLHAFEFNDTINTTYSALMQQAEKFCKAEHYQMIHPYLELTHRILTTPAESME
ncbi:MAG: hypothetical protein EP343_12910 [Deltaproteobacteria bacterium]|nr:MAG: hypothetical protein EP343_12910 [Deltaproteobacteria bacterium]